MQPYIQKALNIVRAYVQARLDKSDDPVDFEVYAVWFSKTLKNWKALVSTTLPDSMYYEVTYDGNKGAAYLDAYRKVDNVEFPDDEIKHVESLAPTSVHFIDPDPTRPIKR